MLKTLDQPEMVEVTNKRGQKRMKPKEVVRYNKYMTGIDRAGRDIVPRTLVKAGMASTTAVS